MTPIKHSILSASSSHRWLNCTPSAMLTKDIPDEVSVYAEEGTATHELAEYKVRDYLGERNLQVPSVGNFNQEEINKYSDVSCNEDEVKKIVNVLNENDVDPIHLLDVIGDIIG